MKKLLPLLFLFVMLGMAAAKAQIVTTEPTPLQEESTDIVIYFHADEGNKGLINQPATAAIYAHTGLITSTSDNDSDWKYAPDWSKNEDKYKMEYVKPNVWKLKIGTIQSFYGVPAGVKVLKLAFVFRNANGSLTGKTASEGDIFVDVLDPGLQLTLTSSLTGKVTLEPTSVSLKAATTQSADISLSVNGQTIASQKAATTLTADYQLSEPGTYSFTAVATANGETVTAQEVLTFIAPSVQKDYPGGVPQMGATRTADGDVIFCLAAPQKSCVTLVGSWDDYSVLDTNTMNYQDYEGNRYFWISVPGLAADRQYFYYYLVDGSLGVGDPYARLILDPYNDKYIPSYIYPDLPAYPTGKVNNVPLAVYQENINDFAWTDNGFQIPDKDNLIIYELLLRDFTGTEGEARGNGCVRLAMTKLNYLKELGVNAIELLPINEFNGNISWGYNPNFYFAPDKAYGTPDDYKAFINDCHKMGIAVILDMVFNQTDWLHPWYQMYQPGSNPFYNVDAPHAYSVLNDWNQGNPLVQTQFHDVLRYWLEEYHVDGFRFDLVKGLGDNDSYSNSSSSATDAYNASRVARMKALQEVVESVKPGAIFINENLAQPREENAMAAFGQLNWAKVNQEGMQYAKGESSNSSLNRFYAPNDGRTKGSTVSYLESHDEQRLAYAQNQEGVIGIKGNLPNSMRRLSSAAAQMIMAPGSHMIWQFSELGNDENTKAANGDNATGPKKVLWSYYDNADRRGLYDCYRDLINLRLNNPDLFSADASLTMECNTANWLLGRKIINTNGTRELLTFVNPNTYDITMSHTFTNKSSDAYRIYSKSYDTTPAFNAESGTVNVPANSYVTIGTLNLTSVEELPLTDQRSICAYPVQGGLMIDESAPVAVYALDGTLMARTTGFVALPAGVYVLRLGAQTAKLLLR